MAENQDIKEITFVDVDKGKISNFFKKRMEQKGLQVNPDRVSDLLGLSPSPQAKLSPPTFQISKIDDQFDRSNREDPVRGMVAKMLEDYEEVLTDADLRAIPTGTRLKYITYDPEKRIELFRQGGYLRAVKPHCVVLAGLYKNVYNKRYRVNRHVFDPHNKAVLLYNTRFFVKRPDYPHQHHPNQHPDQHHYHHHPHPQLAWDSESPASCSASRQVMMMGGSKEEESKVIYSSFQRMSERILARKDEELERLNQRVNQLREREERLNRFRI